MRNSLLGLVLTAVLLPVTTVHAAPAGAVGKAAAAYDKAIKNTKEAIKAGVEAGLTVEEAMAELLEEDPANAANIVAAAVAADPANAGAITAFAISKGVPPTLAVAAATAAAPQQAAAIQQAVSNINNSNTGLLGGGTTASPSGVVISGGSTGGGGGGSGATKS